MIICRLGTTEIVSFEENRLEEISYFFSKHRYLVSLDLRENNLTKILECLKQNKTFKRLSFVYNPIKLVPKMS